jgi:hypothetical protein
LLAVAEQERHATNTRWRTKDPGDRRRQRAISNHETNFIWTCRIGDLSKRPDKNFRTDAVDARWVYMHPHEQAIHGNHAVLREPDPVGVGTYNTPMIYIINAYVCGAQLQSVVRQTQTDRSGGNPVGKIEIRPLPDNVNGTEG